MTASTASPWDLPVKRARYGLIFVAQLALWMALYYGINAATAGRCVAQPLLPGEAALPRVSAAYPVYALVYVQIFAPLLCARTRRRYVELQLGFTVASVLAFAVFIAAPMPYPRPPLTIHSVTDYLLSLEYATDGTRCTFPSLHVAISWLLFFGLRHRGRGWAAALAINASAISVATVLVKQHFIVDVVGGLLLASIAWRIALRLSRRWLAGAERVADGV